MQNIYVQKEKIEEKSKMWWEKLRRWIVYKQNRIKSKVIGENSYLYTIPNIEHKNTFKKLKRKVEKERGSIVRVIFSKETEFLKENWKEKAVNIEAFKKISLPLVLTYLLEKMQEDPKNLQLQEIYFCAEKASEENKQIICYFLEKVKTVNIVTPNLNFFQKLEEKCQKEKGIWLTVSNNKRKSLSRAKWIINLDFSEEKIDSYQINRQAIVINCTEEKIINKKGFEGIIIQSFDVINIKNKQLEKNFTSLAIKASEISFSMNYEGNVRKMEQEKVKIRNLIGINGKIDQNELLNCKKFLTNKRM